ncbi:hypothetical protein D5F01_LYC16134 [Larimichthys crocea]|uniref:Uncharacterized protein n=1 Tax=Larimichthys crocea TaxID=215358 RepID=A0A6G0I0A7_LARCR|nr:hypothetical protein D5F01_LYC16134 [Larimichthys crocea]
MEENIRGLRIHQGKKRYLSEKSQGPRIDYFLQKESNQLNEVHQLDENHSLESISTPVMEGANSGTKLAMEQTSAVEPTQTPRPAVERRLPGHKPRVNWPGAVEKKLWERTENSQKRRRKKEQTRTRFYKDPFKFLKTLFTKEKSGVLKTTQNDLEEFSESNPLGSKAP